MTAMKKRTPGTMTGRRSAIVCTLQASSRSAFLENFTQQYTLVHKYLHFIIDTTASFLITSLLAKNALDFL
jgi:hypothetical protein